MVEVIQGSESEHADYGGGHPLIHIHKIDRFVHGNGIGIAVYGEMKLAAGEAVFARELMLNTLQVLLLTPEVPMNDNDLGYMAQKFVYNKGLYGNYASIDVYDDAGTWQAPGTGPTDGSIWLDFLAHGE